MDLFDFLHLERHNKRLSQLAVAKATGVSLNLISQWEAKKHRPRIDLLMAWGGALGYKLKWEPMTKEPT